MALLDNDKANVLFKHYLGTGSSRLSREFFEEAIKSSFIVKPDQLWKYSDMIPDGSEHAGGQEAIDIVKGLHGTEDATNTYTWFKSESEPKYPIVKKWTQLQLSPVDMGTDNSFVIIDPKTKEPVKNIIPFNYGSGENEELYNYHLYMPDASMEIPFGVGDWVVDTYSGIVTFYDKVPEGINHLNPPLLTFFQYVGGNGFRQDINGFEAVVLPLDNVSFDDKACTTSNGIYKKIVDVCEKIEKDFTKTYGFDGYDEGEGVALVFEKIIPLLYGDTHDVVKGYDQSADQVIRTLLSSKKSNNDNVIFVSQKTPLGEYKVTFKIENEQLIAKVGTTETTIRSGESDDDKWKIFLDDKHETFVIINPSQEETTFIVGEGLEEEVPVITCALLYWDSTAKDYLPFVNREPEKVFSFGVPVVAAQGKIPPSLMLDTDTLNAYQDIITPEYYGPRMVSWVIAHEGGRDIKSADFIVKEHKVGCQLEHAIAAGKVDGGKVYLRDGVYGISKDFTLSGNVVYEAECNVKLDGSIKIQPGAQKLTVVNGLQINGNLTICGEGVVLLNNVKAQNLILQDTVKLEIRNSRFNDITLDGAGEDTVILHATTFNNILTKRDNIFIENCNFNEFTKDGAEAVKPIILESNLIKALNTKTSEIYLYSNYISKYNVTGNQTPVEQHETGLLGTSGRVSVLAKGDPQHQLYAEFAKPFNYYKAGDIRDKNWPEQSKADVFELLYNPKRLIIDEFGRLDTSLNTNDIVLPPGTEFPRGDNSWDYEIEKSLESKKYGPNNNITEVLKDLWHEKADLNAKGKVPLQQLPDEVSYGGMLYIGNWCFDAHDGKYPTKEDIDKIFLIDPDPERPNLQPGWFFIVEPPATPDTEEESTDNPVKPQEAIDGRIFTAGDWLVVQTRIPEHLTELGKGWTKIDRAFSEPIYSILSPHTERTGEPDTAWWWRDDGDKGGALPLGNKTLIQAIDDINMQLRKLEPKKPEHLNNLQLKCTSENLPYISWIDFATKEKHTELDFAKIENITYETRSKDDSDKMLEDYFYFGDEAEVSSKITNDEVFLPVTKVTRDSKTQTIGTTVISEAVDPFEDADHGMTFWKGLKITTTIPKEKIVEGENTLQVSVDKCMLVEGEDKTQHTGYAGTINTSFVTEKPYFSFTDKTVINSIVESNIFEELMKKGTCSGNFAMDMADFKEFVISFTLDKIYKNQRVPTGVYGKVYAELNGELLTEEVDIPYENTFFLKDNSSVDIKSLALPINENWNTDKIIRRDDVITFHLKVYDFYGAEYTSVITTLKTLEVDKCSEPNRVTHGLFNNCSQKSEAEDPKGINYGAKWDSIFDLTRGAHNSLQRYGRMIGERFTEEYRWPDGKVATGELPNSYVNYEGETITDAEGNILGKYAGVCLDFGPVKEISGFTFEIEVEDDKKELFKYNSLTAETENMIIECCIRDETADPSVWLNCNKANNGFLQPRNYKDPAMYAGHSSALIKRVTFGRQCLSGELYLRVAIKKDSGLQFKGIKLIEVI